VIVLRVKNPAPTAERDADVLRAMGDIDMALHCGCDRTLGGPEELFLLIYL
jgi:hypothetical protein